MTESHPLIRLEDVTRIYPTPAGDVRALDRVSLEIPAGEFVAVTGPPGSGKSTLLSLIGCLDAPTGGNIWISGVPVPALTDDELSVFRRDHFGFVFQEPGLFPLLTILENVEVPLLLKGRAGGDRERCREVLGAAGLSPDLFTRLPAGLTGGEQQRAAIARALVNDPGILLCDEPTGNLGREAGEAVLGLLSELSRRGKTVLVATHDARVAGHAGRTIRMDRGEVA